MSGLFGEHKLGAYCAAKAAVVNYTRVRAMDHGKDRIRANDDTYAHEGKRQAFSPRPADAGKQDDTRRRERERWSLPSRSGPGGSGSS